MIAELEHKIGVLLLDSGIPGLGLALVENGQVLWANGFGSRNTETGEPIADNSIFPAASVSKPVSACLALGLCNQDELDLDVSIGHYLDKSQPDMDSITPRQILSHTSGLPNWLPDLTERLRGGDIFPAGCVLSAEPGERYLYSGEGYFWLQRVVEAITHLPFHIYAEQELFTPWAMRHSSFIWRAGYERDFAFGHDDRNMPFDLAKRMEIHSYANAAASLYTTALDLAVFLCELMDPSRPEIQRVVDTMIQPQISLSDTISWGLGWGIESGGKGRPWYWHHGRGQHTNLIIWSKDESKGLVVMTNTARHQEAEKLEREIVGLVLGGDHAAFDFMPYERMKRLGFVD